MTSRAAGSSAPATNTRWVTAGLASHWDKWKKLASFGKIHKLSIPRATIARSRRTAARRSYRSNLRSSGSRHPIIRRRRHAILRSPHPVPDRLLGVLRHQLLALALRALVVDKSFPGVAEECCELGPRVRRAHIDKANGLDARPRRLYHDEVRNFAGLDAAPELLFRRYQDGEIERVHRYRHLDPFAAAG